MGGRDQQVGGLTVLPCKKPSIPAIDNFILIKHSNQTRPDAQTRNNKLSAKWKILFHASWIISVQHLPFFTHPSLPPPPTAPLPLFRSRPTMVLSQNPPRRSRNEINRHSLVRSVLREKQRLVKEIKFT